MMTRVTLLLRKWNYFSIITILFFPVLSAYSAEQSLLDALEEEVVTEEITITGERTISNVLNLIEQAEERQYKLFNDLVEDRELQILCENVAQTGTFIRKRDCEPRFMKTARRKARSDAQPFTNTNRPGGDPPVFVFEGTSNPALTKQESENYEALNQELIRLGTENKALGDAILEIHRLREIYRELRIEQLREERLARRR